jgi:hypothetical protein
MEIIGALHVPTSTKKKMEQMISFGVNHVTPSGTKITQAGTTDNDTVNPVSATTCTTVTTVERSAGMVATITVQVMMTTTKTTHLSTTTPIDLALLSLEKESII